VGWRIRITIFSRYSKGTPEESRSRKERDPSVAYGDLRMTRKERLRMTKKIKCLRMMRRREPSS